VTNVGIKITLEDGSSVDVRGYDRTVIDGLDGDLEDGATFRFPDGCTVTRQGEEAVWSEPAQRS
jgi:hypothetical protein